MLRNIFWSCLVPVLMIIGWDAIVRYGIVPSTLVASPLATLQDMITMLQDGTLLKHTTVSLIRLSLGFSLGTIIGIIFGAWIAVSRMTSRLFEPTLSVLAPIPAIAWVPLLIMLFGIEETSKVLLIALGTFFVVSTHVIVGIRATSRELVELAQVLGKNQRDLFWFVLLPSALPEIFVGMRVAMGLSWTLLLVSEIIASSEGLGWLIWDARNFSRPDDLFVGMICVVLLVASQTWFLSQSKDIRSAGAPLIPNGKAMSNDLSVNITDKFISGTAERIQVLGKCQFDLRPGELLIVLGESGCGKSTLLRMILALDKEFTGSITSGGKAISAREPNRGMVFQDPRLLPWMTTLQNIEFAMRGDDTGEARRERALSMLKMVGLSGFENSLPRELSGGMAQRAALARALVNAPGILLLDEPFSALDLHTRYRLQDELLNIIKTTGATTMMVTHDIDEALYLGDRILVMSKRPGCVKAVHTLGAGKPRQRTGSDLADLHRQLLAELISD